MIERILSYHWHSFSLEKQSVKENLKTLWEFLGWGRKHDNRGKPECSIRCLIIEASEKRELPTQEVVKGREGKSFIFCSFPITVFKFFSWRQIKTWRQSAVACAVVSGPGSAQSTSFLRFHLRSMKIFPLSRLYLNTMSLGGGFSFLFCVLNTAITKDNNLFVETKNNQDVVSE